LVYFEAMNQVNLNGKLFHADEPVLFASNRGYRYGDGLFETMKLKEGKILLEQYHFERLFNGLHILRFEIPSLFNADKLRQEILHLCKRNECEKLARIRLSVFRGNGGLYEDLNVLHYLIECWPLPETTMEINQNGLDVGIFPGGRKNADQFSNLKSSNFLLYSMAAIFAREQKWNDCLVLNTSDRLCDATTANIFIIKNGIFKTPALSEGCVAGVMRRKLIEVIRAENAPVNSVEESGLQIDELLNADEVFLTNAIHGIRWIKKVNDKIYSNKQTVDIYSKFLRTLSE